MKLLIAPLLAMALSAGSLNVRFSAFTEDSGGKPAGWTTWSARAETAPRCFVDALHFHSKAGSLAISGNSNIAEYGGWQRLVPGVQPGMWYRFTAFYRTENVAYENWQVVARLDWRTGQGQKAGEPDYVYQARREGAWTSLTMDTQAPEGAESVVIELYLSDSPLGTVWWDDISLEQIPAPGPRNVAIASVNYRPQETGSAEESVRRFLNLIDASIHQKTDVILLPEGITVIGTGKSYADVAETIPGPTTLRLGEMAKKRNTYVVAGIYEREGPAIYNTAVLIDRAGNIAGKYRKVYVPREEIDHGLMPGNDYPVFATDFGTVGLMICYDVMFPDPARALTNRGAEIILMPIWGGDETLAKARAIENKVFLVASGYDHPTYVMNPNGDILSIARQDGTVALAVVDLNKRYVERQLGEMHSRRMKELRLDIRPPLPGFTN